MTEKILIPMVMRDGIAIPLYKLEDISTPEEEVQEHRKREYRDTRLLRHKLFGQTVCLLANWMGQQGWSVKDACKVFDALGVEYLKSSVQKQISYGRGSEYRKEVLLDEETIKKLEDLRCGK